MPPEYEVRIDDMGRQIEVRLHDYVQIVDIGLLRDNRDRIVYTLQRAAKEIDEQILYDYKKGRLVMQHTHQTTTQPIYSPPTYTPQQKDILDPDWRKAPWVDEEVKRIPKPPKPRTPQGIVKDKLKEKNEDGIDFDF